jgi:hypothetical protein
VGKYCKKSALMSFETCFQGKGHKNNAPGNGDKCLKDAVSKQKLQYKAVSPISRIGCICHNHDQVKGCKICLYPQINTPYFYVL